MKVKVFPFQPHCFAFGGFELQMLNALKASKNVGVIISKIDYWDRSLDFDIVHLWGIGNHNYQIIEWSKKNQKIVVASVLLPYFESISEKLKFYLRFFFSRVFRAHLKYFSQIDRFSVVNNEQKIILNRYYKIPVFKIDVIPNIVENKFFLKPQLSFKKKYNIENFVLCTGNITKRKNQVNLIKACEKLDLFVVLIGNIIEGEEGYTQEFLELISKSRNVLWLKDLSNSSEELIAAYYDCDVFILPSTNETQPISILEAKAVGKQIILLDRKYAHQKYFENAIFAKSNSIEDIANAFSIFYSGSFNKNSKETISDCSEENVGNMFKVFYKSAFSIKN